MMFHAVLLPSGGFKRKKGPQKRVRTSFLNNPMSPQLFLKRISQKETAVYKIVRDRQQYPRILIHICLNGPLKQTRNLYDIGRHRKQLFWRSARRRGYLEGFSRFFHTYFVSGTSYFAAKVQNL